MTKLDELNTLLETESVPSHRNHVDTSGRNLKWLKKHVAKNKDISPRLAELINTPITELVK